MSLIASIGLILLNSSKELKVKRCKVSLNRLLKKQRSPITLILTIISTLGSVYRYVMEVNSVCLSTLTNTLYLSTTLEWLLDLSVITMAIESLIVENLNKRLKIKVLDTWVLMEI
jgi:hypothetical protein